MSMSFESLVLDNVREFGILDTVRALRLHHYTGRQARIYIERLLREQTGGDEVNYQYQHFTVEVDEEKKAFLLRVRDYVLDWSVIPANVARDIDAAIADWRKRGYRYAEFGEELDSQDRERAAEDLESRLQAIVNEERTTGGEL